MLELIEIFYTCSHSKERYSMQRTKLADRKLPDYTHGEEIMNMVTHIVGTGLGVAATVLCIIIAALKRNVFGIVGGAVFGASMILLYTMSSVYHGLSPRLKAKKVFQIIDHCSIFLLIAGTYTPIALCSLREYDPLLGWGIFGIVWAAAALGMVFNAIDLKKYAKFSMICYLGMGWCIVFAFKIMLDIFSAQALALLISGGIAYTVGAVFYGIGRNRRYMHSLFHCFVLAGSITHILFVLLYVL